MEVPPCARFASEVHMDLRQACEGKFMEGDTTTASPQERSRRSGIIVSFRLLASTLAVLIAMEMLARGVEVWRPPLPTDTGLGFDAASRLFFRDPEHPGRLSTQPARRAWFQTQSFEAVKPPTHFRVFFLGGSSINYIHHLLPEFARELRPICGDACEVEVINCGGLAYGSARLVTLAREVLQLEPDLILLYNGHNEFEELVQWEQYREEHMPIFLLLDRLAIYRLLRELKARWQIQRLESAIALGASGAGPEPARAWSHVFSPEEIATRMAQFEENTRSIVSLCRERGVPIVIATVPSNLMAPRLLPPDEERYRREVLPLFGRGDYARGVEIAQEILGNASRHQSSRQENAIIRRIAEEWNIPLADVERAIIAAEPRGVPGETLFSDWCHFNDAGNRILLDTFRDTILRCCSDSAVSASHRVTTRAEQP